MPTNATWGSLPAPRRRAAVQGSSLQKYCEIRWSGQGEEAVWELAGCEVTPVRRAHCRQPALLAALLGAGSGPFLNEGRGRP